MQKEMLEYKPKEKKYSEEEIVSKTTESVVKLQQ